MILNSAIWYFSESIMKRKATAINFLEIRMLRLMDLMPKPFYKGFDT